MSDLHVKRACGLCEIFVAAGCCARRCMSGGFVVSLCSSLASLGALHEVCEQTGEVHLLVVWLQKCGQLFAFGN